MYINTENNQTFKWGFSPETLKQGKKILVYKNERTNNYELPGHAISNITAGFFIARILKITYFGGHWFLKSDIKEKEDLPAKEYDITCTRCEVVNYV